MVMHGQDFEIPEAAMVLKNVSMKPQTSAKVALA
jgi:hypothetical protein